MIFPHFLNFDNAKAYIETLKVSKSVEATKRSPKQLRKGEFIVITSTNSDKIGQVVNVKIYKSSSSIFLGTSSGIEEVKIGESDTIHIVKKADLKLNEHDSYERDLYNVTDKGVPETSSDETLKFPPTTKEDTKVIEDKTSELPAAKKLSLHKKSITPQFKAKDFVRTSVGVSAQIVEIIPGDVDQSAQAILRSSEGNRFFTEYLVDLMPDASVSHTLSLKRRSLSLHDHGARREKLAKLFYRKSFDSLSELEKADVIDKLSTE